MSTATYDLATGQSVVVSFLRIGAGYPSLEKNETSVFATSVIPIGVVKEEFLLDKSASGEVVYNGEGVIGQEKQALTQAIVDEMGRKVEEYARLKYWQYLRNSEVVEYSSTLWGQTLYVMLTYVNVMGRFLVVGSYDKSG